jgi:hypothetical protein
MNNNTISRKVALMTAILLSAIMLTASSIPSLIPARAFAQEDGAAGNLAETLVEDKSVIVDPSIQLSTQTAANVNTDIDVYIIMGCNECNVKISDDDK